MTRSPEEALTSRVEYEGTAALDAVKPPAQKHCRKCDTIIDPVVDRSGLCVECEGGNP